MCSIYDNTFKWAFTVHDLQSMNTFTLSHDSHDCVENAGRNKNKAANLTDHKFMNICTMYDFECCVCFPQNKNEIL